MEGENNIACSFVERRANVHSLIPALDCSKIQLPGAWLADLNE